jgi:hypothetical protein
MRVRIRRATGITLAIGGRRGAPDCIVGMSPFGIPAVHHTGSRARSATLIRHWHGTA